MGQIFDCIIVGSGPAGGTAAYHLTKKGHSVLVLEKAKLPRYKPCGGGVSPVIQDWFDFDFSPAISLKTNQVYYTWEKEKPVQVELKVNPIWMVRREIFDHFIVQQAQKQGAQVKDNTTVTGIEFQSDRWLVKSAQETFSGRYLIGADGAKGVTSKWLGFKKPKKVVAGALELEVAIPNQTDINTYFEFGLVNNGYAWNFPKADGYSIGAGAFWKQRKAQNFKKILLDYATMFNVSLDNAIECGHPISLWDGNQKLHTQNAVLAGEAACVIDPLTAEGIRPSIFSGLKASEAIDNALSGDINALEKYTETMAEEWGKEMMWAQKIAQFFYRFPKMSYDIGVQRPSATSAMSRIFCGELSYSDVAIKGISVLKRHMKIGF